MSTNELTAKVREIKELETMAAEIAAEIETLKDQIKAEMTAAFPSHKKSPCINRRQKHDTRA